MSKEKTKNKKTIIIIAIILFVIGTISGFLFTKLFDNGKDIVYINEKRGQDGKIAFIISGDDNYYAVTVDGEEQIDLDNNFFDESNLQYGIENFINDMAYIMSSNINLEAQKIEIFDVMNNDIVKSEDRWLLLKNKEENERYTVGYCMDENYNAQDKDNLIHNVISLGMIHGEEKDALIKYDALKNKVKVYNAKKEQNGFEYKDAKGNIVNLNEYRFMRDIITKSLFDYDIYIRNSMGIKDFVKELRVNYQVVEDENETTYEISKCNQEYYEQNKESAAYEINYSFEHNGKKYEVTTTEIGESLNFYTKINDNEYINIFMTAKDIDMQSIEENLDSFVERLKQQLL